MCTNFIIKFELRVRVRVRLENADASVVANNVYACFVCCAVSPEALKFFRPVIMIPLSKLWERRVDLKMSAY